MEESWSYTLQKAHYRLESTVKFADNHSRYQTQKHKLPKLLGNTFDPSLSEADNTIKAGFVKIYDCGNAVYEWRK